MGLRIRPSRRRGSLILEAVVASLLLATATVALAKLAKSTADLGRHADQNLAARLAAGNALERLRVVPFAELTDRAATVAEQVQQQLGGGEVQVQTAEFEADGVAGLHLRVDASPVSDTRELSSIRISLHDWRFQVPTADSTESPSDESPTDVAAEEQDDE